MSTFLRALVYATTFVGFVLIYLPSRILAWAGVPQPVDWGPAQWVGGIVTGLGAMLALWCVIAFAFIGRGTPAPFDPPRKLVTTGPYRFLRNPMYVGAGLALAGAALFYQSIALVALLAGLTVAIHLLVVLYEEPTLRRMFGAEYEEYCREVRRWQPRRPKRSRN